MVKLLYVLPTLYGVALRAIAVELFIVLVLMAARALLRGAGVDFVARFLVTLDASYLRVLVSQKVVGPVVIEVPLVDGDHLVRAAFVVAVALHAGALEP